MVGKYLEQVRTKAPLIHNITNYVTVNDVANVLLACGGSPIMSDEPADIIDITSICNGLNINIGTLNVRTIEAMYAAGEKSNELNHAVLLDPVGAGASKLRTDTALGLIEKIHFDVIRGNISEIKTLALGNGTTKGVDADMADAVTDENLDQAVAFVKGYAAQSGSVIAITGAIDLISDGKICYVVHTAAVAAPHISSGLAARNAVIMPDNWQQCVRWVLQVRSHMTICSRETGMRHIATGSLMLFII